MATVFISAKSEDYPAAREVYDLLANAGADCFFSDVSLPTIGRAEYKAVIDRELETATHLVLVTSSAEHAESHWIHYEWNSFDNEILSRRKQGNIITVLCEGLMTKDLPYALRRYETLVFPKQLGRLPSYVGIKRPIPPTAIPSQQIRKTEANAKIGNEEMGGLESTRPVSAPPSTTLHTLPPPLPQAGPSELVRSADSKGAPPLTEKRWRFFKIGLPAFTFALVLVIADTALVVWLFENGVFKFSDDAPPIYMLLPAFGVITLTVATLLAISKWRTTARLLRRAGAATVALVSRVLRSFSSAFPFLPFRIFAALAAAMAIGFPITIMAMMARQVPPTMTLKVPGVSSVAISPDGNRIAITSAGRATQIWDAQDGKPLGIPMETGSRTRKVSFSPDGKRMVTVCREEARIWDIETRQPVATLTPATGDSFSAAQFSPRDGKTIVTASGNEADIDGVAQLWDVQTGKPLGAPMRHKKSVGTASFSPDGQLLVTVEGNNIWVWDVASGQHLGDPMFQWWVKSARFSPSGDSIISNDLETIVWDTKTRAVIRKYLNGIPVSSFGYSPVNVRWDVYETTDGAARLVDSLTGDVVQRLRQVPYLGLFSKKHAGSIYTADCTPDGKTVVTGSHEDESVRVWRF